MNCSACQGKETIWGFGDKHPACPVERTRCVGTWKDEEGKYHQYEYTVTMVKKCVRG